VTTLTTPRRPEVRPPRAEFDRFAWRRAVVLLHIALAVLVALYVLQGYGRPGAPAGDAAAASPDAVSGSTATGLDPRARSADRVANTTVATAPAPHVADALRSDFTTGDPWPVGAASRDTAAVSWPLGVVHGVFVHGPADGPGAVSWLARALPDDVRAVGARVRFAAQHSGAVALTAWHTSVLAGMSVPRTGMRLVAPPGHWRLVAIDRHGTATLAAGRYDQAGPSASFGLVRRGPEVWVTDPAGLVTRVSDPRVAALAGPWASWELRDAVGTKPVAIEEIWAG
jgi:hypothetical protein